MLAKDSVHSSSSRNEWDIGESMRSCTLCPRRCHADRLHGQRGRCGQGADAVVARAALHPWEEPCISGTRGSGTVFFSGCPLGCIYCQNAEIARSGKAAAGCHNRAGGGRAAEGGAPGVAPPRFPQAGKIVSVERLGRIFIELQEKGAHNINLVTPLHFAPQAAAALRRAKAEGLTLPVVCNCGGYESVDTLKRMEGLVDIYLPDLKYVSADLAESFSGAPDYFEAAQAAQAEMVRQTGKLQEGGGMLKRGVVVRHLVLPGHTKEAEAVIRYLLDTYGNRIAVSLLNQYTPCVRQEEYPELNRRLTRREYEKVVRFALDAGLENGYFQEGGTASESFIPPFDAEGV